MMELLVYLVHFNLEFDHGLVSLLELSHIDSKVCQMLLKVRIFHLKYSDKVTSVTRPYPHFSFAVIEVTMCKITYHVVLSVAVDVGFSVSGDCAKFDGLWN